MANHKRSPHFIADAYGLDFLNRISPSPHQKLEPLKSGNDLLEWLAAAGLVPCEALTKLKESAVPGELDAVASQARALGSWFRQFVLDRKGSPLPSGAVDELAPLNRILEGDTRYQQVDADRVSGGKLVWRSRRQWQSSEALLLPIAEVMTELVCSEDFTYVRTCEGADCHLLFLDRTRGRARRWCSMAGCGNRAKQATRRNAAHEEH